MSIQNDGFTKDPGGSGGGGEAPAGTGFVRVTDGAYDTPAALSATEIPNLDTAKITTGQFVDGRMPTASNAATIGAISTVANAALPKAGGTLTGNTTHSACSVVLSGNASFPASSAQYIAPTGGNINYNVPSGLSHNFGVAGISYVSHGANGIILSGTQSSAGSTITSLYRDSTGNFFVQGPTTGCAQLYGADASNVTAHGLTNALRPASISLKSVGKAFTNNGTWTNFYSLAEGTHSGVFRIFSSLAGMYVHFAINSTTLNNLYDGWTVASSGAVVASFTASAGVIAFRISGGILQINVGTSVSASGYFHAIFEGNVR